MKQVNKEMGWLLYSRTIDLVHGHMERDLIYRLHVEVHLMVSASKNRVLEPVKNNMVHMMENREDRCSGEE